MDFHYYFVFQSTFMDDKTAGLETLKDIKQMMERSSRFISLSGLSGIAAGICALVGAWLAYTVIDGGSGSSHREYANQYADVISLKAFMGTNCLPSHYILL